MSNKSVSRWESGSYPDVPTLLSLARALDVTVDALLDPGAPGPHIAEKRLAESALLCLRHRRRTGLLFTRRFRPRAGVLGPLSGRLAYGIYLQTHYTYHARWFRLGSWAMCFCVSWTLAEELGGVVFQVLFPTVLSQWKNMIFQLLRGDAGALLQLVLVLGPLWLAGACGLTVLTQLLPGRLAGERGDLPVRLPDLRGHPRLGPGPLRLEQGHARSVPHRPGRVLVSLPGRLSCRDSGTSTSRNSIWRSGRWQGCWLCSPA